MKYLTFLRTLQNDIPQIINGPKRTKMNHFHLMCGQVVYPAAVLNITKNEAAARDYLAFLTTEAADELFKSVGFSPMHE